MYNTILIYKNTTKTTLVLTLLRLPNVPHSLHSYKPQLHVWSHTTKHYAKAEESFDNIQPVRESKSITKSLTALQQNPRFVFYFWIHSPFIVSMYSVSKRSL